MSETGGLLGGGGPPPVGGKHVVAELTATMRLTASLTATSVEELRTVDVSALRDLLHRLWTLVYAGLSNRAVHGLIALVTLLITIADYEQGRASDAAEQERERVVEQQRQQAPPIVVQPAPVIVVPDEQTSDDDPDR